MKGKFIFISLLTILFFKPGSFAQSLVIDHDDIPAFDNIPPIYKEAAANLRMLFMDRSVGGNISFYLDCLSNPWSNAPNACKRFEHQDSLYAVDPSEVYWENTWDRSHWRYEYWPAGCAEDVNCFIDYMDGRLDSFDVMGCQFSYLAVLPGSTIANPVTGFFGTTGNDNKASTYAAFATTHPDKQIIWWTTSLARGIGTTESMSFNEQMRNYADTADIILFDVADILSHDPDGNPCFDNRDGVMYKDENYPDDSLSIPAICPQYTTETEGGHLGSISAGGIRVAKAFWVLMARLAGWEGVTSLNGAGETKMIKLYPNPADEVVYLQGFNPINSPLDYVLFDPQGRQYLKQTIQANFLNKDNIATISIASLSSGVYFLQIKLGSKFETLKLVVY